MLFKIITHFYAVVKLLFRICKIKNLMNSLYILLSFLFIFFFLDFCVKIRIYCPEKVLLFRHHSLSFLFLNYQDFFLSKNICNVITQDLLKARKPNLLFPCSIFYTEFSHFCPDIKFLEFVKTKILMILKLRLL